MLPNSMEILNIEYAILSPSNNVAAIERPYVVLLLDLERQFVKFPRVL